MRPEGYETLREAIGEQPGVYPNVEQGEDARFVLVEVYPKIGVKQFPLIDVLNQINAAGLMEEQHEPADEHSVTLPAFRVLSIDNGSAYLEDTNSSQKEHVACS